MKELIDLLDEYGIDYEEDANGIIFKTNFKGLKVIGFEEKLNSLVIRFNFRVEMCDTKSLDQVCERNYIISHQWYNKEEE